MCIREVQKSLKDSAKKIIEDKIHKYNLIDSGFRILHDRIETPGDGLIIFLGMSDQSADSVKSLEGFGVAWVEEANTLSDRSLQLLRPTIRDSRIEGFSAELWFSYNPSRKADAVDQLFRGEHGAPTNSVVVEANYNHNPWFPDVLEQERLDDKEQRPDSYDHVWNGGYITAMDGAYFAKVINQAKLDGRISKVAIDPLMSVYAFWDIGGTGAKADACSIWMCQFIGKEIRVLNYYEAQGQDLATHVGWLNSQNYQKAIMMLPHDGVKHDFVNRVTYESALKQAGFDVKIMPNAGAGAASQRVEATRRIFSRVWMDKTKCEGGLEALGWYHEKKDLHRGIGLGPNHDWSSHAADSFGALAVEAEKLSKDKRKQPQARPARRSPNGWMR
jgi:phage terminase large subunit